MELLGQNEIDHHKRQVAILSQDCFYRVLTPEQKAKALKGQFNFDHPGTSASWPQTQRLIPEMIQSCFLLCSPVQMRLTTTSSLQLCGTSRRERPFTSLSMTLSLIPGGSQQLTESPSTCSSQLFQPVPLDRTGGTGSDLQAFAAGTAFPKFTFFKILSLRFLEKRRR